MTRGPSWWPTSDGAPPLHATRREPSRETEGWAVAEIAKHLGTPLLPWQRYVSDVALERRPDGGYEYQVVVVSVPRQTGKTTLIRAVGTHACLVCGRDVFYTAQTGKDARERWMDLVKLLQVNPALRDRIKVSLRGGGEQVLFRDSGAAFRVFAPKPESLHGYTPPKVMIDEAFALDGGRGELLMGAIGPAQQTIVDRQLWIVSTAGTAQSTFLHEWIDRAIEGMPRVAVFLWGAGEDQDPYTAEGIAAFHPGMGFRLNGKVIEPSDVLEQIDRNTRAEYERAYANRRTITMSHLIPVDAWRALADTDLEPPTDTRDVTISYDVGLDRLSASIVATWVHPSGCIAAKVVQAGPGTSWLADAVDNIAARWRPVAVGAVDNGPVLDVTAQLRDRGLEVETLGEREYAAACGATLSRISDSGLVHDGGDALETSVTGLVTRPGAVDGVAFTRRHSVGDSSAGIALAAGLWLTERRLQDGRPLIDFAS